MARAAIIHCCTLCLKDFRHVGRKRMYCDACRLVRRAAIVRDYNMRRASALEAQHHRYYHRTFRQEKCEPDVLYALWLNLKHIQHHLGGPKTGVPTYLLMLLDRPGIIHPA